MNVRERNFRLKGLNANGQETSREEILEIAEAKALLLNLPIEIIREFDLRGPYSGAPVPDEDGRCYLLTSPNTTCRVSVALSWASLTQDGFIEIFGSVPPDDFTDEDFMDSFNFSHPAVHVPLDNAKVIRKGIFKSAKNLLSGYEYAGAATYPHTVGSASIKACLAALKAKR